MEAGAYPHPVRRVELVQTHISWVLLTGAFAYKIKRPVCHPFVDMRDAARRLELCHEELRLNRRFTAELYLDVCPVMRRDGVARMGGEGEVIEHAVRMRQFPREHELDRLLASGSIEPGELRCFGEALAAIHETLPCAGEGSAWGGVDTVRAAITANVRQAIELERQRLGTRRIEAMRPGLLERLDALAPWMGERLAAGRVRECHGDLHCGNVVRWNGALHAFDCLEFDPALRWMDVAQEIAFLLADLDARHATAHAHAFISGYLARGGDYPACRGIALYKAHCALVRAKVMAIGAGERVADPAALAQFVAAAERSLAPRRPVLIVMMGLSGSGKTRLASRLAPLLEAVHLQSDVERRRLAGMRPGQRSGSALQAGVYAPQATNDVYAHLAHCAEEMLRAGWSVIVDATFTARERRATMRRLAAELGVPLKVIACRAPVEVLRHRVTQRAMRGGDASEADATVLEWQLRREEPLRADEDLPVQEVDTSTDPTTDQLAMLAGRCH
jgi:aminoglycoside phosphotransferase family enzyme/predicted kinase